MGLARFRAGVDARPVSAESSFPFADHGHAEADGASTLATIVAFLRRLFRSDRV
jgi:hypothetical protein